MKQNQGYAVVSNTFASEPKQWKPIDYKLIFILVNKMQYERKNNIKPKISDNFRKDYYVKFGIQDQEKNDLILSMSFEELFSYFKIPKKSFNRTEIIKQCDKLIFLNFNNKIKLKDNDNIYYANLIKVSCVSTKDKMIYFVFNDLFKNYFIDLTKNFTKYQLLAILGFSGKYSNQIYLLLHQFLNYKVGNEMGVYTCTTKQLKDYLCLGKEAYTTNGHFDRYIFEKRCIIEPLKEVNKKSDLKITYKKIYGKGMQERKIQGYRFLVKDNYDFIMHNNLDLSRELETFHRQEQEKSSK